MELEKIVTVTGLPGLYEILNPRPDGMIVKSLTEGKTNFISNRKHSFTTLDNIVIYTSQEPLSLKEVVDEMKKKEKEVPMVDRTSDKEKLTQYFRELFPEYDESQVYPSHIKKIIGWFEILRQNNYFKGKKENKKKKAEKKDPKK